MAVQDTYTFPAQIAISICVGEDMRVFWAAGRAASSWTTSWGGIIRPHRPQISLGPEKCIMFIRYLIIVNAPFLFLNIEPKSFGVLIHADYTASQVDGSSKDRDLPGEDEAQWDGEHLAALLVHGNVNDNDDNAMHYPRTKLRSILISTFITSERLPAAIGSLVAGEPIVLRLYSTPTKDISTTQNTADASTSFSSSNPSYTGGGIQGVRGERSHTRAWKMVNVDEALDSKGVLWDVGRSEWSNLRGRSIRDVKGAKAELNESIKLVAFLHPKPRQNRECVHGSSNRARLERCLSVLRRRSSINLRIRIFIIIVSELSISLFLVVVIKFDDASENYTKSTELDDQFGFSHIQLAVAHYEAENLIGAMAQFRRTMKSFPQRSEPLNYYGAGELLLDQQRYQDAIEKFDKATEIEEKERSHSTLFNTFVYITTLISLTLSHPGLLKTSPRQQKWTKTSVPPDDAATKHSESTQRVQQGEAAVATLAQASARPPTRSDSVRLGQIDNAIKYLNSQTIDRAREYGVAEDLFRTLCSSAWNEY
ncbi:hypothetical protein F5878DRAFT_640123 [Lentinula raphanica]|uniref:TPR-like protein n=1 Tax=Lentinula raphanica TaxID=153919 RepID=A0AA38UGP6_9AGAR|nr:hypothetical protein F5878DRAFT_640123 [Lentinula raphanica]